MMSSRYLDSLSPALTESISIAPGSRGVTSPFQAAGRSGILHSFTLGRPGEIGIDMVCDVVVSEGPVDETKVLSLFIKAYDAGAKQTILCVSPGLSSDARKLADIYRIKIIVGPSQEDATAKLISAIAPTPV